MCNEGKWVCITFLMLSLMILSAYVITGKSEVLPLFVGLFILLAIYIFKSN